VNLNVGTPETPFDVHVERLCDCSPYFERMFQDRFDRVRVESVSLPDDDSDIFTEFLSWVYTGKIFQNEMQPTLGNLFQLWILAEKFEVPELQNLAVALCNQRLDSKSNGVIGTSTINYVYSNTLSGSLLRQMSVEIFVQRGKEGMKARFSKHKTELPRAFLEDLCEFWFEQKEFSYAGIKAIPDSTAVPVRRFPSPTRSEEEVSPPARQASIAQMETRSIKIPKTRNRSNRASPSTNTSTPSATSADTENDRGFLKKLEDLEL